MTRNKDTIPENSETKHSEEHHTTSNQIDPVELTVVPAENAAFRGNAVSLPRDLLEAEKTTTGSERATPLVEVRGRDKTVARVLARHPEGRTIAMDRYMRDNLNVDIGDTVTVQSVTPVPAEQVTITVPVEDESLTEQNGCNALTRELSHQAFTTGDFLPLIVVSDENTAIERLENEVGPGYDIRLGHHQAYAYPDPIYDFVFPLLPVCVSSVSPEGANCVSNQTDVVLQVDSTIGTDHLVGDCNRWEDGSLTVFAPLYMEWREKHEAEIEEFRESIGEFR